MTLNVEEAGAIVTQVELVESERKPGLAVRASDVFAFLRDPERYWGEFGGLLKSAEPDKRQVEEVLVSRFLADCRLSAGEKGKEPQSFIRFWRKYLAILRGDIKTRGLFIRDGGDLRNLAGQAETLGIIEDREVAKGIGFFLRNNPPYGFSKTRGDRISVTPFVYKAEIAIPTKPETYMYQGRIDDYRELESAARVTTVEMSLPRGKPSGRITFELGLMALGCLRSRPIERENLELYAWGIRSRNNYRLFLYDENLVRQIAASAARAVTRGDGNNEQIVDLLIRLEESSDWRRVSLGKKLARIT